MKFVLLLALALSFAPGAACAGAPPTPEPRCAFSDERTMTLLGLYTFAAEHYVQHRSWPESRAQLQAQAVRLLGRVAAAEFFARLPRLDLQRQGGDLRLSVRFRAAGRVYRQRAVLHPGQSADAILQAATDPDAA